MNSSSSISAQTIAIETAKLSKRSAAATATALQIEQYYSQQILTGKLPPGSRLPPNSELTQIWKTSNATVQRALSKLTADGLVARRQGRGTFVRDKTEQSLIGAFLGPSFAGDAGGFYRHLLKLIRDEFETEYTSLRIYDGLTDLSPAKTEGVDSKGGQSKKRKGKIRQGIRSFVLDSRYNVFNGYIFLATSNIEPHEAIDHLAPSVALHDERRGDDVILDSAAFLEEALAQLLARGAKKIAYLQPYDTLAQASADILTPKFGQEVANRVGVPEFQFWNLFLSRLDEIEADAALQSGFLDDRIRNLLPDAIIISDDIVARPIIFNLVRRGYRIPQQIKVCVRTIDAQPLYYGEPVYRYTLPVGEISQSLVNLLRLRMSGQADPELPIRIEGKFCELSGSGL
jgi:hypothetical protein